MHLVVKWLVGASVALAPMAAHAQFNQQGFGFSHSAGGAYVGPGDVISGAAVFYGLRGYTAAFAATGTGKAVGLRRASDNSTMDLVILPNGNLDVASAATFCASTTCFVPIWYDQSGNNCDVTQATEATQPQLVLSGVNGLPGVLFSGSQELDNGACAAATASQPFTMAMVAERTGAFTAEARILDNRGGGAGSFFEFYSSADTVIGFTGGFSGAVTLADSVLHDMQFVVNGESSLIYADGATGWSGAAGGNGTSGQISLGRVSGVNGPLVGYIAEAGQWNLAITANAQLHGNTSGYWGTP